jgi:hypothetical protein
VASSSPIQLQSADYGDESNHTPFTPHIRLPNIQENFMMNAPVLYLLKVGKKITLKLLLQEKQSGTVVH